MKRAPAISLQYNINPLFYKHYNAGYIRLLQIHVCILSDLKSAHGRKSHL